MGYLSIENLYRPRAQQVLMFKRVYALEKIHGTSAHVSWDGANVNFFSGGENHNRFVTLFDVEALKAGFLEKIGYTKCIIYGEAYGGKQQGMSATYGSSLKFIAFDVQINESWLSVPQASDFVTSMGLEFVDWAEVDGTIEALDAERDKPLDAGHSERHHRA